MIAFARFNAVGLAGFGLQIAVLAALASAGASVPLATCVAVEAAVLHNFIWHERWTWPGRDEAGRGRRLARFHLSNGLVSMVGNAVLTTALVQAGSPLVPANAAAALVCAFLNFATAHLWVFATERRAVRPA